MTEEAKSRPWKDRAGTKEGDPEENKYPHNRKIVTSGGVEIDIGNEPGKQYVKIHHPSGTYMTVWPDGKMETFVRGENRSYTKGGVTLTVDENQDVHIKGHSKFQVAGGAHFEVSGDAGMVVGGNMALVGLNGSLGMQVKNFYLGCQNFNLNATGATTIETGGDTYIGSGGSITQQSTAVKLNPGGKKSGYRSKAGGGGVSA